MRNLIRTSRGWDPFHTLEALQDQLNGMIRGHRGQPLSHEEEAGQSQGKVTEWLPLVDIKEDDKEYLFKAELPEVKKEDLNVTVEEGVLSISGERKMEKEEKGGRYHRIERSFGSFTRSFTVPEDAVDGDVKAEFKEGVLTVHLAKTEKSKPKAVDVKVH